MGSPQEMADALRGFAREGIEEVQCGIIPGTTEGITAFAKVIRLLDSDQYV
jgi:hypothetical protein